jgi:hypothetical protein
VQSVNNNGDGILNANQPYNGNGEYVAFIDGGGGGGGGSSYVPPTPPNPTFVPPTYTESDNNRLKISLISDDSAEFLQDNISVGIGLSSDVIFSPALQFGSSRTYKSNVNGKISTNYFIVSVEKTYSEPTTPSPTVNYQDYIYPIYNPNPDYNYEYFNGSNFGNSSYYNNNNNNGYYNINNNYGAGYNNTNYNWNYNYQYTSKIQTSVQPTKNDIKYTENILVREYELNNNGTFTIGTERTLPSTSGVVDLRFKFKIAGKDIDGNDNPIETGNPKNIAYEIAFASNFQNELGDILSLKYEIVDNSLNIVDGTTILLKNGNTNDKIISSELLKNSYVNLEVKGELPEGYTYSSIYYTSKGNAERNSTEFSSWNKVGQFFKIQSSELAGGIVVAAILEKDVKVAKPEISVSNFKYDAEIKESDVDKIVNVTFSTTNTDYVYAYVNADSPLRVSANQGYISLFFNKDFRSEYGTKKIYLVPVSDLYGTGDRVEVLVNFIAINDFPSITQIIYPDSIDVPSFSDLQIDYEVQYNSFAVSSIDVELLAKDNSRIGLFKNLPPNGAFKINLRELADRFSQWNGNDNVTLIFKPFNRGGEEELIGNEYTIITNIAYPVIRLDEDIIRKSIYDAFIENLKFIEPERDSKHLTHLANFGNDEQIIISSWENDNWTLSDKMEDELGNVVIKKQVNSTILKLYSPLPANITSNSTFWITKLMSNPLIETVVLNEQDNLSCPTIKGPNFNIDVDFVSGQSTNYESLDNLILSTSPSSSANLVSTYLSSSLNNTDELNIDYTNGTDYLWNNFVHFSSATERVDNFVYKVQLIEAYETAISASNASQAHSGSLSSIQESERQQLKKNQLVNAFDGFENFLYESSSMSWPYIGNSRKLSTTNDVTIWYENIIELATIWDNNNPNFIKNNIPQYIVNDENNESYLLFFTMVGQHFDNIYYHTKAIEKSRGLGYKAKDGISDKLLFDVLKSFNWDAKNLAADEHLWEYTFGLDSNGTHKYDTPAKQRTYEVWRRIVNNLPYLLKHKGTKRGVYALLSCYGIPASNLSILEFGGPEIDNNETKSKLVMDNVTTALKMNSGSYLEMDWKNTDKGRVPNTIEMFVKPAYAREYQLISGSNWGVYLNGSTDSSYGQVKFTYSGSNQLRNTISSSLLPIFNDKFFGISVSSGSNGLQMDIRQADKERTLFSNSVSASSYTNWNSGTKIKIGEKYSGSLDEFRLWSEQLDTNIFNQHVSFPEMINGNSYTASTHDLYFRLDFEYPKNLAVTQSMINVDTNIYFSGSLTRNNFENGLQIITGSISNITLINGGSGYTSSLGTSNGTIPLYFVGGEFKQIQPSVTGSLTNGVLTSISISHGGTGMVSFPNNLQPSASLSQSINNSITPIVIELTGSVANFVSENITPLLFATASGFTSVTSYPYQFEAIDRTIIMEVPDGGASRYSTNKIRFESQTDLNGNDASGGIDLSIKQRATKKAFDQSPTDSNRVGLFFSPTKELNIDIAKSLGGLNIDDYIGDPSDDYKPNYSKLDSLRNYYFQRFDGRDIYSYINLIKLYEKSMFDDIKKMLPARVKATTGLLIEPHFLERSKIAHKKPSGEDYQQETSIHFADTTIFLAENQQYETVIDGNLSENLFGENNQYDGTIYTASVDKTFAESYQLDSLINPNDNLNQIAESFQNEVTIDAGLGEATILSEIDIYATNTFVGQSDYENVGFGIYAQNGHAIRTYFDTNGRRVKERIKVDLIKEQKQRDVVAYNIKINGKGDPRGGYHITSSIYYETKLNIQPYSGSKVINAGTGSIVEVTKVNGYLPTHYRNTSDLTRGLENSFYRGSKNTAATTLDGSSPIETFVSNPNTLRVNKTGRDSSEPILEVE